MRFVAIPWLLWAAGAASAAVLVQNEPALTSLASVTNKILLEPKKLFRDVNIENNLLQEHGKTSVYEVKLSTNPIETLITSIYNKEEECRKLKGILAAYLGLQLSLSAIQPYMMVSPPLALLMGSVRALMEKMLPNLEERWTQRQTELQRLVWDYLGSQGVTEPPVEITVYHGKRSVTIPVLTKSKYAELPDKYKTIGKSNYAKFESVLF